MTDPYAFAAGNDTPARSTGTANGVGVHHNAHRRLNFTHRIVPQSLGKPIPTADLVTRLKKLHNDLAEIEQEEVITSSLNAVQKDLRSPYLLSHRDKGVRILTACCLAEILRLYAPDAPYNQKQLREIFELFAKQLQSISDKDGPYYHKYFALLDSLSTVKSVVLVADLDAETLVLDFFQTFFDLLKFDLAKPVTMAMVDILQQLVDECHHLPAEVIELILKSFEKPDERPNAFKMATDLCNACPEKLQRYVCQHFSDAIISAGGGFEEDEDAEEAWRDAHSLILAINRASPGVLLNVIPLLDEELKVEDTNVRTLATNVLGEMFSVPGSVLARNFTHVWKSWLGRRMDKQSSVRIAWLDWALPWIRNHPDHVSDIDAALREKCMDPDDKVRSAALKVIGQLDSVSLRKVDRALLWEAGGRLRDRKANVREAAVEALAQVFNLKYPELADPGSGELDAVVKYGWIPGEILGMIYTDNAESKVLVEKALCDSIFPPNVDDVARTDRLLRIVSLWTPKQHNAFINVLDRQAVTMKAVTAFLEQCEAYNGGIMNKDGGEIERLLLFCINYIAARFPEPRKAATQLQKFAKANDGRLYKLIRNVMDLQTDYKPMIKHIKEIIKRLEQQQGVMETFSILLRRISLTIVPKSSVSILLDTIQESRQSQDENIVRLGETAEKLLKDISTVFPALYRSNLPQFTQLLQSSDDTLVADSLEALAKFARVYPDEAPQDAASRERLTKFALEGTPEQARNAVTILAHMRDGALEACTDIMDVIMETLAFGTDETAAPQHLVTHLAALSQLAFEAPAAFEPHHVTVTNFIVKQLLFVNRIKADSENDVDWIPASELHEEAQLKLTGVKILVQRLVALADNKKRERSVGVRTDLDSSARPVLKLFRRLLEFDGELAEARDTPAAAKTALRLKCGLSLLELARCPVYASMISVADTYQLALLMQDPIYEVRKAFTEKLITYLSDTAIPFNYMVMLMVAAHEPDVELKTKVKTFLQRRATQQRAEQTTTTIKTDESSKTVTVPVTTLTTSSTSPLLEHILVRFLHLLAHHPDYSDSPSDLVHAAKYIDFFLDVVATAENAAYLYHVSAKLKTTKDLHKASSDPLYTISELAQMRIQDRATTANWTLPSYPGRASLPADLVGKLSSAGAAEITRKRYLPDGFAIGGGSAAAVVTATGGGQRKTSTSSRKGSAAAAGLVDTTTTINTPDASDHEDDTAATGRTPAKRKAPARRTPARKRRKSREDDDDDVDEDDDGDEEEKRVRKGKGKVGGAVARRAGATASKRSESTPQRKNAPRSARKTYVDVASEAEDDEEGEADASEEVDEDAMEVDTPAPPSRRRPAPASIPISGNSSKRTSPRKKKPTALVAEDKEEEEEENEPGTEKEEVVEDIQDLPVVSNSRRKPPTTTTTTAPRRRRGRTPTPPTPIPSTTTSPLVDAPKVASAAVTSPAKRKRTTAGPVKVIEEVEASVARRSTRRAAAAAAGGTTKTGAGTTTSSSQATDPGADQASPDADPDPDPDAVAPVVVVEKKTRGRKGKAMPVPVPDPKSDEEEEEDEIPVRRVTRRHV
ncbi:hypothetical protein HKX48_006454 [Thoreauomyces humboldtii]|nr:hypothetical protein HKX48_006454 [Thoreauomyces humboldtii]